MTGSFGINEVLHLEDLAAVLTALGGWPIPRTGSSRSRIRTGCGRPWNGAARARRRPAGAGSGQVQAGASGGRPLGHPAPADGAGRGRDFAARSTSGGAARARGRAPPGADRDLRSAGWQAYLPDLRLLVDRQPADVGLPALPALTEPAAARSTLEAALRRTGEPGRADPGGCTPRVMRYREGLRGTIATT